MKGFPLLGDLLSEAINERYSADRSAIDEKYWDLFAIPENRSEAWK